MRRSLFTLIALACLWQVQAYANESALPPRTDNKTCKPPYHIRYKISKTDKKTVTFTWEYEEPDETDPILSVQIYNYNEDLVWDGSVDTTTFTDHNLTTKAGRYPYYFYATCTTGRSYKPYRKTVTQK